MKYDIRTKMRLNEIVVQNAVHAMEKQIFNAFKLLKCNYNELSSVYYGRFLKFLKWRESHFEAWFLKENGVNMNME